MTTGPVFSAIPERIISMSPAATEILFALSLGERLVGITRFCDYPPEAAKIPKVASLLDINLETLLSIAPDFMVLDNLNESLKERIERLGITTFVLHHETLKELCDSIEELAAACSVFERGKILADSMRARFFQAEALTRSLPRPKVVAAVDRDITDPVIRSLYIAGKNSFYDELIYLAGGRNAFTIEGLSYPRLTAEGLIGLDPDLIIDIVGDHGFRDGVRPDNLLTQWDSRPELRAVKEKHIYLLAGNYALHPGPRLVLLLQDFLTFIHPELKLSDPKPSDPAPAPSEPKLTELAYSDRIPPAK
jgi:iron complex transport system substrate-binding protein